MCLVGAPDVAFVVTDPHVWTVSLHDFTLLAAAGQWY